MARSPAARVISCVALALCGWLASPPSAGNVVVAQEEEVVDQAGYVLLSYGLDYQGRQLGCPGTGKYDTNNLQILAVGYANDLRWPCHTPLKVCGPTGLCLDMERLDTCPGCSSLMLDTTEASYSVLCGAGASGPCPVSVREGISSGAGGLVPSIRMPSTGDGGYLWDD